MYYFLFAILLLIFNLTSTQGAILFEDDFDRTNSTTVGNGWTETDSDPSAEAQILNNRLDFDAVDDVFQPMVEHTFTKQTSGKIKWTYIFNFERTGSEGTYEVRIQLGEDALMVDPSTSRNTGVAVNLIWGGPNRGLTNNEGFGYDQGGSITEVGVVSGDAGANSGGDATIEIIADLDANTFDLTITGPGLVSGTGSAYGVAFDNNVDIDIVRIFLDDVNQANFGDLEIDNIRIEIVTGSSPTSAQKALDFDGVDDYVITQSNFSPPSDGTLTFWIKVPGTPSSLSRMLGLSDGWEIRHETTGRLHFDLNITGTNDIFITNSNINASGVWYHIAAVFSSTNDTYEVYVNGILDKSGSLGLTSQSANLLSFGTRTGSSQNWEGTLDEIAIWNRELNISEIRTNLCQKLSGSESGLVGYWRFDEITGFTCYDSSSNGNNGTMTNMTPATDRVWSGAALGDESAYDYTGVNPGDFSASIAHSNGDNITATGDGGTVTGIHVYRVDETSLRTGATGPTGWTLDPLRYWGVFIVGTNPTHTISYSYDGHPGITNENDLALAIRDNNADNTWIDVGATLNTTTNTLTKTGQGLGEYALGSRTGDNSLPVELTAFKASYNNGVVMLFWQTESEIENVGFIIKRTTTFDGVYQIISSYLFNEDLRGQFNSTTAHQYAFIDENIIDGETYWYKLVDVDVNGTQTEHGPISIVLALAYIPDSFDLYPAFPNPFNPATTLRIDIPAVKGESAEIELSVYNSLGQRIKTIHSGVLEPGSYDFRWNGLAENGYRVATGIYFSS